MQYLLQNLFKLCDLFTSLTVSRISFFKSIAERLEPFLKKFQTDFSFVPFLHESLNSLLRSTVLRFVKKSILENATTSAKLCQIDVSVGSDALMPFSNIDVGFATRKALKESKAYDKLKSEFQQLCCTFLSFSEHKFLERNLMTYRIIRSVSCLSPSVIINNKTIAEKRLIVALEVFIDKNRIQVNLADSAKSVYNFVGKTNVLCRLKSFHASTDRLDALHVELLKDRLKFHNLWNFAKQLLLLSYSNATVERGVSINKDILVKNLLEHSLVAQRVVHDVVYMAGGHLNVPITKELIRATRT